MLFPNYSKLLLIIYIIKAAVVTEEVHLSDSMNVNPLDLLHEKCGYHSKSKLLEGFMSMLFTGSGQSVFF